jgi:hypothetical protein
MVVSPERVGLPWEGGRGKISISVFLYIPKGFDNVKKYSMVLRV